MYMYLYMNKSENMFGSQIEYVQTFTMIQIPSVIFKMRYEI